MSREIKFRAWDAARKKMHTSAKWVEFRFDGEGKLKAVNYHPNGDEQRLPVMQFTGLRDANGAEIWEGDILENAYGKRDIATMDRFPVFWMANEKFGFEGEDLEQSDEWVVIGNIYEHPHLLDDAK